jgi:glycosyltransferase involved in cell wall biosynthesis
LDWFALSGGQGITVENDMLKVLIASSYTSKNAYVRTIVNGLKGLCEVNCSIEEFWSSDSRFDIVHIQWPEELFYWAPLSSDDLKKLQDRVRSWRERGAMIVLTRHNELPHKKHALDRELYEFIFSAADGVIHLGEYSRRILGKTDKANIVIRHPSYVEDYISVDTHDSRKRLHLPTKGRMFLSLGQIRSTEESDFLIEAFLQFRKKSKGSFLVICNFLNPARSISIRRNPFRRVLAEVKFILNKNLLYLKGVIIDSGLLGMDEVNLYMNAADVVVVPRLNTLNSGVVYLGFTYGKPVVGPRIGNIREALEENENILFSPGNTAELVSCLRYATANVSKLGVYNKMLAEKFSAPEEIASQHLNFYLKLKEQHFITAN